MTGSIPPKKSLAIPMIAKAAIAITLKAGGAAFFNGHVLHRSLANRAKAGFRRALVTHYMSAESLLPWTMGAPTARADVRDIVMVAGDDLAVEGP